MQLYRHRVKLSYYSAAYAEALKPVIVALSQEPGVRYYRADATGKSVETLYLFITRAWAWLKDHDTSDKFFTRMRKCIKIVKAKDRGYVMLEYKGGWLSKAGHAVDISSAEDAMGIEPERLPSAPNSGTNTTWRAELDNFVEGGVTGRLSLEKLNLSIEEVAFVKASLVGLDGIIIVSIGNDHVIVEKRV